MEPGTEIPQDDVLVGCVVLSEYWVVHGLRPIGNDALPLVHAYARPRYAASYARKAMVSVAVSADCGAVNRVQQMRYHWYVYG